MKAVDRIAVNRRASGARRRCTAGAFAAAGRGAQRRQGISIATYEFAPTGSEMPYRIYVPTSWDGKSSLPILLFLHGAGANESTYLDVADGLLRKLAEKHGYIVVSPLGFTPLGAYGNPLRLPAVFGESATAAAQRAAVTPARRRELDLSELEVVTVLEIVTEEYGADRSRTFLAGHSMGSGGVWHLERSLSGSLARRRADVRAVHRQGDVSVRAHSRACRSS